MGWQRIMQASELIENELVPLLIGNFPAVAVLRHGEVYVYEDRCPHVDYPLSTGYVDGDEIVCTWHGACFAVDTGEIRCPPADGPLNKLPSRVSGEWLEVDTSAVEND